MASLKENLQVQTSGAVLAVQEGVYKGKSWFWNLPQWERIVFIILLVSIFPGSILVRYGTELYLVNRYNRESLSAQPAYSNPDKLTQSKVSIVKNSNGTYSAYSVVTNPNLDLGLDEFSYNFSFLNESGEEIYKSSGKTFLLPNQKKWLVVPKIQTEEIITSGKLVIGDLDWQKRLSLPEVELKTSEPYIYEQDSPIAVVAEGTVVNNSPYTISEVSVLLVLYDRNNQIIAVTPRQENRLKAYERRAYKLQWPGIMRNDVARIGIEAYTNTMDNNNLVIDKSTEINNLDDQNQ